MSNYCSAKESLVHKHIASCMTFAHSPDLQVCSSSKTSTYLNNMKHSSIPIPIFFSDCNHSVDFDAIKPIVVGVVDLLPPSRSTKQDSVNKIVRALNVLRKH